MDDGAFCFAIKAKPVHLSKVESNSLSVHIEWPRTASERSHRVKLEAGRNQRFTVGSHWR